MAKGNCNPVSFPLYLYLRTKGELGQTLRSLRILLAQENYLCFKKDMRELVAEKSQDGENYSPPESKRYEGRDTEFSLMYSSGLAQCPTFSKCSKYLSNQTVNNVEFMRKVWLRENPERDNMRTVPKPK